MGGRRAGVRHHRRGQVPAVIERRKMLRRKADQPPRDLAQYAHIMSAVALTAALFVLVTGFFENRQRQAEVRALAVETRLQAETSIRENCLASERVATAVREVLETAIETRQEVGDPDADLFEQRYREIIAMFLQPRQC